MGGISRTVERFERLTHKGPLRSDTTLHFAGLGMPPQTVSNDKLRALGAALQQATDSRGHLDLVTFFAGPGAGYSRTDLGQLLRALDKRKRLYQLLRKIQLVQRTDDPSVGGGGGTGGAAPSRKTAPGGRGGGGSRGRRTASRRRLSVGKRPSTSHV